MTVIFKTNPGRIIGFLGRIAKKSGRIAKKSGHSLMITGHELLYKIYIFACLMHWNKYKKNMA
jgi:hypothetical protein